jgi:hypothetical protein
MHGSRFYLIGSAVFESEFIDGRLHGCVELFWKSLKKSHPCQHYLIQCGLAPSSDFLIYAQRFSQDSARRSEVLFADKSFGERYVDCCKC